MASLLEDLVARRPDPESHREVYEQLCRKLEVFGRIDREYTTSWRRRRSPEPLADQAWPLLVEALLLGAEKRDESNPGFRLKCLNAACKALDRVSTDALEAPARSALESRVNYLLDCEGP